MQYIKQQVGFMVKRICSVMLLWVCLLSAASAQDSYIAANSGNLKESVNSDAETAPVVSQNKESIVFMPELKEHMLLDSSFGTFPKADPYATKPTAFILPASLMAAGTICLLNEDFKGVNRFAKESFWDRRENYGFVPDDVTMFVPFIGYYGLNIAGVKSRHNMIDGTLIYFMASAINNSIVFTVKNRSAIERPDASDRHSFPSGHTAQAFVSAEFLRQEYKHISQWYGVAGYAFAVSTGILRMRHNKHWLNDVVAGAGVGILSTRISYWLYPKIKKLVMPNSKNDIMIAPTVGNGAYGLSFMYSFK